KWINILKMFPLIYRYGCADVEGGILEAITIFQSSNVPAEHAGSTAVQTAHKDVLAVPFMFLWHNFVDSGFPERLPLAALSRHCARRWSPPYGAPELATSLGHANRSPSETDLPLVAQGPASQEGPQFPDDICPNS